MLWMRLDAGVVVLDEHCSAMVSQHEPKAPWAADGRAACHCVEH